MATVIHQHYLAHSSTGFEKVDEGITRRWPSGGLGVLDSNYIPQVGDVILMDFDSTVGNPDAALARYGLKRGNCVGGVAFRLEAN